MLSGKLAVISGGGSGIGRAICAAFSKQGSKVAVVDVNKTAATQTLKSLEGPQQHAAFAVDVSCGQAVSDLLVNIKQTFSGVPSIAVNCAGITRDNYLLKLDETSFDEVIAVNLKGTFLLSQAVGRHMVENAVQGCSIINISSIVGKVGNLGQCNYASSKAGVIGFSKSAAKELAKFGIRCNSILPGFIETPMLDTVPEKLLDKLVRQIPLARIGQPEEIADVCVFLASDRSSYITGATIEVSGGLFM
ncbi:Estradiol 17-beta-dehydrogenase 8 [Lamellibrachia satsuma]|nr:Estradiol 17-beta-dehydrogenase 8 [Lamellibrachia satsuma]